MPESAIGSGMMNRVHRGWGIALACFLAYSVTVGGSQYSFGHFVGPLEAEFGWSRTEIGLSLSLVALGSFVSPFFGAMIDRHGARKIMAVSMLVFGLSYLARPIMNDIWHWYALGAIQSFAMVGGAMLPIGKLIGQWFPKNRGRILGITAMGNNFGGAAIQPAVALIISVYSWRIGYTAIGLFGLVVAIYILLVVKSPPVIAKGSIFENETKSPNYTLKEALSTRRFYAILVSVMCGSFTYSALLPQVSSHLINKGISEVSAAIALSLFATCGMAGKLIFGILADRYGSKISLIIDLVGQAVFAFLLIYAGAGVSIWFVVPFMGFFLGAFGALYQLIIMDSFGLDHFGSILGVISITNAISFFAGPIIAGQSFDITGSYGPAFAITAVIFVIGALALTLSGGDRWVNSE